VDDIDRVLADICQHIADTVDEVDVKYLMRSKGPIRLIEQEASGPDRARLILSQVVDELNERPADLPRVDQLLMQLNSSSTAPCLMRELVTLQSGLLDHIGKEVPYVKLIINDRDEQLNDRLGLTLLIWLSAKG
jgi:hypothetical protein